MKEHDIQDYLYANPKVLFPSGSITERAREYSIHGKRIDLLFAVDGIRYIVEIKNVPIQREHIGQVVEYYGLMKHYMHEANLSMVLVSPSIPAWRAAYLEELGIRCVELPTIPTTSEDRRRIESESKTHAIKVRERSETLSVLGDRESFSFTDVAGPVTLKSMAFAQRMLRDSLEPVRKSFTEYDVVPFRIRGPFSPDYHLELDPGRTTCAGRVTHGGTWWAYRFGFSEDLPKNDVANISIIADTQGLDVAVNAELLPSQKVLLSRIGEDLQEFDSLLADHGGLWLKTYLKYEHQPRFYHWILADLRSPMGFDGEAIVRLRRNHEEAFVKERERWIREIIAGNKELTKEQARHMQARNTQLNLAIRLVQPFRKDAALWSLSAEKQLAEIVAAIRRMKPLIDFFIK